MCWAMLMRKVEAAAVNADLAAQAFNRIATAGKTIPILKNNEGQLSWTDSRYGLMFKHEDGKRKLIWCARDDKLKTVPRWKHLANDRCAFPVAAFAERSAQGDEDDWFLSSGWMIGFHDAEPEGGTAFITRQNGNARVPFIVDENTMHVWLNSRDENVSDLAASFRQCAIEPADIFTSRNLAADARNYTGQIQLKAA